MSVNRADLAREIVREYIDLGIKHNRGYSKRFIAAVLQSKHPDVYKDFEDARFYVRRVTGAQGRKLKMDKQLAEDFALLENPITECELKPFIVPKQYKKPLIINDVHSKFHDRRAVEVAVNHGAKRGCDLVIINGDLFDFYQFSRFDKNNRIRSEFYSEREWAQDFLLLLQKTFGKVISRRVTTTSGGRCSSKGFQRICQNCRGWRIWPTMRCSMALRSMWWRITT